MKTDPKARLAFGALRPTSGAVLPALGAVLFLLTLLPLPAQITVKTLGGGPLRIGGPNNGFVDGATLQESQFNYPIVTAVDPAGILYIADRDNNAVRRLDIAGDVSTTYIQSDLDLPVGLVFDRRTNIYVINQGDGTLRKFDRFANADTVISGFDSPTAIAIDTRNNLYVAELSGNIQRVSPTGEILQVASGFDEPRGVAVLNDALLAVTANHAVYLVNLTTFGVSLLAGSSESGFRDGIGSVARFDEPNQIAATPRGNFVVADRFNHRVRVVDLSGEVSTLYGVSEDRWLSDYPGWEDGNIGIAEAREPVGVTVDGTGIVYTSEVFYHIIRQVTGADLGPIDPPQITGHPQNQTATAGSDVTFSVTATGTAPLSWQWLFNNTNAIAGATNQNLVLTSVQPEQAGFYSVIVANRGGSVVSSNALLTVITGAGSTNINVVPAPTFGPFVGFFPMGRTIVITSSVPIVFFTIDGTEPTTNSMRVTLTNGVGVIEFNEALRDITSFCVRAFDGVRFSATVCGSPSSVNEIGVSRDFVGGIGATVVVPITVNLRTNAGLRSIQFRVEIRPENGGPMVSDQFRTLSVTTNDFIPIATSSRASAGPSLFDSFSYTFGTARGLAVSFIATNANFAISNFAAVAILAIPVPPTASEGDVYRISILQPSGTSDGLEEDVPIGPAPDRFLRVQNISYLVGDSAPSHWYNAGDFGDNDLRNNDVNNAFIVSLGLRSPFSFSDLFNAMDAYPEDTATRVGGDGQIRFLDWQVILFRSLRLESDNWRRSWSPGGSLISIPTSLSGRPNTPAETRTQSPGAVWLRQAVVGAIPRDRLSANRTVDVPVYVRVASGATLAGLQFRAAVRAQGSAPPVNDAVQFVPSVGVGNPRVASGMALNEVGCAWNIGGFSPGLQGSNVIGNLRFNIPNTARAGDVYRVVFLNADGAPDLQTEYNLETVAASVFIDAAASNPDFLPTEWKTHFFGSDTSAEAAGDNDADQDGISNWAEYLAGTDPVDAGSRLRLLAAESRLVNARRAVVLRWLSAPGKKYILESTADLHDNSWNTVATDLLGTGDIKEYSDTNLTGSMRFYRVRLLP